jgi:hypothetical protein
MNKLINLRDLMNFLIFSSNVEGSNANELQIMFGS